MRPTTLLRLSIACSLMLAALITISQIVSGQPETIEDEAPLATPVYNPYPPGILPSDLNAEIARVLREIDVIENRAIERWHSLPPPTVTNQPPILKDTGTEAVETLVSLCSTTSAFRPAEIQRARLAICRTPPLADRSHQLI